MSGERTPRAGPSGYRIARVDNYENLRIGDVHEHHYRYGQRPTNVQVGSSLPSPPTYQSEKILKKAADAIQKCQSEKLKSDMAIQSELPEVYQNLAKSDIFETKELPKEEPFYPYSSAQERNVEKCDTKKIHFGKLLSTMMGIGFLALIGPPGCGKTTLAKRLSTFSKFFVIFLRFMDLGYDMVLTPQQLLIDFPFKDVDQATRDNAFAWMLKNQEKCVFVFDGYDQSPWSLGNQTRAIVSYDSRIPTQQIVANLCCKNFFEKSLLIFTSRPHAILSIPRILHPKLTVAVGDLPKDGMKELFFTYAGDKANNLWKTLNTHSPQLIQLCHSPMLLQFVVYAGLHGSVNQFNTTTKVFQIVLLQLETSVHKRGSIFGDLVQPLGKMAFIGMVYQTVVFTIADLEQVGLRDVNVQDFVIKVALCPTLFEGDRASFHFTHQALQEIFAALYICKAMPISEFNSIIYKVVYESHWSMVRRFVCGILLGDDHQVGKSGILRDHLIEFMKNNLLKYQLMDLLIDIQECSDDEKDFFVKFLPVEFNFSYTIITSSTAHALAQILPRFNRPLVKLNLEDCNISLDSLKLICEGISKLKHKMGTLDLSLNKFGNDGVVLISGCVQKVRRLRLEGCSFSATGLEVLCKEIQNLEIPMEFLDLSGNMLGDSGVAFISGCIDKVWELRLEHCRISDVGEQYLRRELEELGLPLITIFGLW